MAGIVVRGRYPQNLIAFLELAGGSDDLTIEGLIEASPHAADVREKVFSLPHLAHTRLARGSPLGGRV